MQYAILENIYLIVTMKFPKLDDSKVLLDFLVNRMLVSPNEAKFQVTDNFFENRAIISYRKVSRTKV